ncbi:pathogenicity island protein [Staphylococcus epidermidis]|uniref:pathogenicity island protein n=1 Tax=Staphylococcus epidermidis TaxID=1282 RepID=UPI001C3DDC15|nr:pathogenicity island protein [Staphylococcus epidermidis]MBV5158146.1 pathogenicity island protein [Staphylococcus epidermidis]MCD9078758.1 pathogenicity island protein [Staphylococcus epidermidis]MEB7331559.1 pathogenicity island protein [Staphylococcus epidermidis]
MLNTLDEKVQKAPRDFVRVYDIINNSKEKYVTKTKILNQLGYDVNKANDRWLTQVITSLIINYQYPVGYSYKKDARGYYIIKSEEDKQQAIYSVKRQVLGAQTRLKALEEIKV